MSALRQLEYNYSESEYWEMEEFPTTKHEFWNGQIYAIAGATPRHNDIAGNVFSSLHGQLRGRACRALAASASKPEKFKLIPMLSWPVVRCNMTRTMPIR